MDDSLVGCAPHEPSEGQRRELEQAIQNSISNHPRLSGPGPFGSRFEHWANLGLRPDGLEAAGVVLTRWLLGEPPAEVLSAHRSGRLLALQKKDGGVRPLACGSVVRRLGARAAARLYAEPLRKTSGTWQRGISTPAGAECMHKSLCALAETRPGAVFLSLDAENAFNSLRRRGLMEAVQPVHRARPCR
jgi:hypothetical protein